MQTHTVTPLTLAKGVSREYLMHHRLVPKEWRDKTLVIGAAPDAIREAAGELATAYEATFVIEDAPTEEIDRLIERLATAGERAVEVLSGAADEWANDAAADVRDLANQPPVVRYVNMLVREAYDAGASDIHLEATTRGLAVRFRLDGVLSPAPEPPSALIHAVVSRLKLLGELDIAERRRPQDGRIRVRLESRELDLRVSTVPTIFGESVVLRLLDRGGRPVGLEELGMTPEVLASVENLASRPHGMLLVTGPTGSGKTTTLYACLARRKMTDEKIITVEDPIEYQVAGVTQVPVHRQAGVTFATALRSILRQDPDVIMVGEMRDTETAEIAVQAAMTGHLVFSTLHTNDAISAIPRLLDLGVPDYLVGGTVEGVLAQRLVRRICDGCRERYQPDPNTVALVAGDLAPRVGRHTFYRGQGCPACRGTGFRGRVGLFELFTMTDEARDAIVRRASRTALTSIANASGMRALRADGWSKVQAGLTTIDEVLRVAQN